MGSFALIALLFTITGIYGVPSNAAERRRQEIGVRNASERPQAGSRSCLPLDVRLVAAGLVFGVAGAALTGRRGER